MKTKVSSIKLTHRELGSVSIKVDAEDKDFVLANNPVVNCSENRKPRVRFAPNEWQREEVSRAILTKHKVSVTNKKVLFKNNDTFDLRKQNLYTR
jgi:hypothetical protein